MSTTMDAQTDDLCYDVVIIGAGISGINFAYRLQKEHPGLRYCILEERHEVGGTWSLFQYPGIRSDSDLFTFGFAWRPWTSRNAIAEGPLIREYIRKSAEQEGILQRIRFHHRVDRMEWSTHKKLWSIHSSTDNSAAAVILKARFVMMGTGYYDYHEPLNTEIPGIEQFQGTVIHPQFWPTDVDYTNQNVVIIGSGATAITLLPSLADKASNVTMLQRSPSYVLSVPREDAVERFIRWACSERLAAKLIRFKWIFLPLVLVSFCRYFPNMARRLCLSITRKELQQVPLDPHFMPRYNPWEQRMCMSPDGDFFKCLRSAKGSVVTDYIEAVTPKSIRLRSGNELHPDIIVTATGLKMRIAGGIRTTVDGSPFFIQDHFMWKCTMVDGLPNMVFGLGYVDASWTLGADATAQLACRILTQMKEEGFGMVAPRCGDKDRSKMKEKSFINLNATYVKKGNSVFPKVGDQPPWEPRSYYWKDLVGAWWGDIRNDMEWSH